MKIKKRHMTSFQIIICGFAGVILTGAILLMLPLSSSSGLWTPFNEALFTSTSAVCVTGLVIQDTATYWSQFGQMIILLLIQVGGLGVVTVAVAFSLLSGKKVSLMQRSTMQDAISAPKVGGIVRLTGFILKTTFLMEFIGACFMFPVFYKDFGIRGMWMAVFHSISAFCNAGFDLLGNAESLYPSLTAYMSHPIINGTIMSLIVIGGIGFLTWEDIYDHQWHFRRYRMQSKVILVTTVMLILFPALYFFVFEFQDFPLKERLLSALFQSVTPRTAGFNTVDLTAMSGRAQMLIIGLMIIGGSPGSTAGGMKTTTFAVLLANARAIFCRKQDAAFFGRRIDCETVKNASTILIMYLMLFMGAGFGISLIENIPVDICLYETASAIGTVGLTLGITPELGIISQMILIGLMFFGRVGGLTLIYAAVSDRHKQAYKLPLEKINVG